MTFRKWDYVVSRDGNIIAYPGSQTLGLGLLLSLTFYFELIVNKGQFTGFSTEPKKKKRQEVLKGLRNTIKTTKDLWLHQHFPTWLSRAAEGEEKCAKVFSNGLVERSFPWFYYLMSFKYTTFEVLYSENSWGTFKQGALKGVGTKPLQLSLVQKMSGKKKKKWLWTNQKNKKQSNNYDDSQSFVRDFYFRRSMKDVLKCENSGRRKLFKFFAVGNKTN